MKDELFNISLDNLSGSMMLTIEPKEKMVINDFCCEMIKKTNVYGLLKLNVTAIDGNIKFNYDLSKKKSIAEFSKAGFNESYGRRILYNLCSAFLKFNEFYLKPNYCLLNPEYTYIGDGLNVYLPYIPVKDMKTEQEELKQYFSELLSKYFAVEGIAAYDEMFKYVYQCQALDLSHFISKFLASEEQSQSNFVAEKQEKMASKQPLPEVNQSQIQQQPIKQNQNQININNNQKMPSPGGFKMPNMGFKMPGSKQKDLNDGVNNIPQGGFKMPGSGGFKMPGGGEINMPGGKLQQKPNVEKKGLFGFGMKNQMPQAQDMQNSMPNVNIPNQGTPSQNIPNQNVQNNNFQQFSQPVNNFQNNNVSPKFNNGFQGNMDRTIMIDGANQQVQNNNMGGGMAYLQYRGQNIPINDSEFVIGKANNQYKVNFVINDNPHVSRKHATILMQGSNYYIRDEGSTNGTYVNGRSLPKMVPQPLQNGDEISIYDEVFRFCM